MKITDLEGRCAKISPRSITVKSESGKTAGVIHAEQLKSLPPRRLFEYSKNPGVTAIRNSGKFENVYIVDDALYYLHDVTKDEFYADYVKRFPRLHEDSDRYFSERDVLLKSVEESGIKVIRFHAV